MADTTFIKRKLTQLYKRKKVIELEIEKYEKMYGEYKINNFRKRLNKKNIEKEKKHNL